MVILIFIMVGELNVIIVVATVRASVRIGIESLALDVDMDGLDTALKDDVLHECRIVMVIDHWRR